MKKRLLITSIVMMLVVAVALSTATYAWFTSATEVTASTVTITAGTSGSSALGIAWSKGTSGAGFNANYGATLTDIAAPTVSSGTFQTLGFQPAAPTALADAEPVFKTAYITSQSVFTGTLSDAPVYRFAQSVSPNSNLVHIANLAQSGAQNVYLTATISGKYILIDGEETVDTTKYDYYTSAKALIETPTGTVSEGYKMLKEDTASLVRIAIFEVTVDGQTTTYTYKGLISKAPTTNDTSCGAISIGTTTVANLKTKTSTTEVALGSLGAQADKAYAIYVWLDGGVFDEAEGGKLTTIDLKFSTASSIPAEPAGD